MREHGGTGCQCLGSASWPKSVGQMGEDWFGGSGRPHGDVIVDAKGWESSR